MQNSPQHYYYTCVQASLKCAHGMRQATATNVCVLSRDCFFLLLVRRSVVCATSAKVKANVQLSCSSGFRI
jgi:hypothetical protein